MFDKKLLIKASLFSSVCGMLISVILMCSFACLILSTGILQKDVITYINVGILGVGAFGAGFISARITKSAGLIAGIITGCIIFIFITIIGLIKSSESVTIITLIKLIASLIGGACGGVLGVNKKEKIRI